MDLLGSRTSGQLSVYQAGMPELPCNPCMFFGFLPHPPSVGFSVFPLHTQCCTPTDTPCDAEWSSRIAAPNGEDQVCLNFFHPTFLLEILCPQLSEGTWLLPPQLMASTKNTWPGATDVLAGVPPSLRVWDTMTGKGGKYTSWSKQDWMTILFSKALLPNSWKQPSVPHLTVTWDTLIQPRKLGKYSKIIISSITGNSYHWKNKLILPLGLVWRRRKKKWLLDFPQTDCLLLSKHPTCFHSVTRWPRHSWCLSHLYSPVLTATSTAWSRLKIERIIRRFPCHQTRIVRWQGEVPSNHLTPTQYLGISYCWQFPQSRLAPFVGRPACLMLSVQVFWILGTFLSLIYTHTHTHTHTHTRFQVYQRGP